MRSTGRSLGSALIDFPTLFWAMRRSWRLCRFSQNSALVPKKWARRKAVSPVIARCPFKMPVMRLVGTSNLRANSAALMPSSFNSSARCSPGCIAVTAIASSASCGCAWQDFLLYLRPNLLLRDLQIICALKIQPVLRRRPEIPGQTHRGVHGDGPVSVDDGADPVHRNPERAPQFVQADANLIQFTPEQFARVDGRQFPSLSHDSPFLVVVHNLDVIRIAFAPVKADPPAVVDPNAVLTGPVALQRLQPVAPNGAQIGEARGAIQPAQPLARLFFDPAKLPAPKSFVDRPGLRASERTNHTHQTYYVRRIESTAPTLV